MKYLILSLFLLTLFSCGAPEGSGANFDTDQTGSESMTDNSQPSDDFILEQSGTFSGRNGYNASGSAQLFYSASTNTYSLFLTNFSTDNGPALKVYLSQDESNNVFTNLGNLQSTSGNQRYDFPASQYSPNLDNVVIWCDAINESFGVSLF